MRSIAAYKLLLTLALAVFVSDQATKLWVESLMPLGTFYPPNNIVVIEGFFHIVHVGNTGAAWSLFSGQSTALAMIGAAALIAIFVFRKSLELHLIKVQLAFGLIIGGIIGNVTDRIRIGHVIDFLDFQFGTYHYPSFNIADSGITIGVGVYLLTNLFTAKKSTKE